MSAVLEPRTIEEAAGMLPGAGRVQFVGGGTELELGAPLGPVDVPEGRRTRFLVEAEPGVSPVGRGRIGEAKSEVVAVRR